MVLSDCHKINKQIGDLLLKRSCGTMLSVKIQHKDDLCLRWAFCSPMTIQPTSAFLKWDLQKRSHILQKRPLQYKEKNHQGIFTECQSWLRNVFCIGNVFLTVLCPPCA